MSRTEIQRLLQTLFHDTTAPPAIAIEAFSVTAADLYYWCDPADVDVALGKISSPFATSSLCSGAAPN